MLREEVQPYVADNKKSKVKANTIEPSKDVKLLDRDQEIHIGCADDDDDPLEAAEDTAAVREDTQVLQA